MSKKDINIRRKWPNDNLFDPNTKIEKVKTNYNRKSEKQLIEDALLEAEEDNTDLDFDF
jgi:hypothetical protein